MIRWDRLDEERENLATAFANVEPFRMVIIDDFVEPSRLPDLIAEFPDPGDARINKSRDAVFARNKFEKSGFQDLGPACKELYDDFCSPKFAALLQTVSGDEEMFVDQAFHGGGLHQGGADSFLDMHVDFNLHPLHHEWRRNLNILLYLNEGWEPAWRGQLKLRNRVTGASTEVEPRINRCVIMETRDFTMHGYDPINFPPGRYRRSIACYAYTPAVEGGEYRATVWYPDSGSAAKRVLGRYWPKIVRVKNRLFGSATAKNR